MLVWHRVDGGGSKMRTIYPALVFFQLEKRGWELSLAVLVSPPETANNHGIGQMTTHYIAYTEKRDVGWNKLIGTNAIWGVVVRR
mmetsp:Transcript_42523/g.49707  ORF Transcript_42523/g.49707 Transcript_42523/m.49707 type:complete len:85 (-) Transcript_42523:167-421(-)